jgi:hypothetical protein
VRRALAAVIALVVVIPLIVAATEPDPDPCAGVLCAGAASVDATWHTGAGQGQLGGAGNSLSEDKYDPFHHQTKMVPTDGIQSRTYAKAIVVRGPDGTKAAYVKSDLYLQQEIMTRRIVELVTGGDPANQDYVVPGLEPSGIMLGGTHNHSAPHYTSTSWGVWIFADAFDYRAFDETARKIARSIKDAADAMKPARVGAAVVDYADIQQNILGPSTADDGSPAGFPRDHVDRELAVIRFDAVPSGDPIGMIVNLALHPESIGGSANLISSDFTGVIEREVERALGRQPGSDDGPVVAFSQGGLGDVEPDQSRAFHPAELREYWRRDFAQAERMSLEFADAVLRAWTYVAEPPDDDDYFVASKHVAFTTDAPVAAISYRFPGPPTHPTHTVSNCRTDRPGIPVIGFPDCVRPGDAPDGYGATIDVLKEAGVPVPDNYGVPSYGAVQEGLTAYLQVIQIGEILLAACPCEPITDMALNFKSRTDRQGEMHLGYEWPCEEQADGTYRCGFGRNAWEALDWRGPIDAAAVERMYAQIRNDAAGWEDDPQHLGGETEPADPAEIKGNFTHTQLDPATEGFTLPLMVGTANDYVGYVVTYREYQRGDHYRKALTPFGPRSADYINTRLVEMARELRGGEPPRDARDIAVETVDELVQQGKLRIFGSGSEAGTTTYEAAIPDDGGTPGFVVAEPDPIVERFGAATFTWEGGSNYTDNPRVRIERLVDGKRERGRPGDVPGGTFGRPDTPAGHDRNPMVLPAWETVATQEGGEVVVTLEYESWSSGAPLAWLAGGKTYRWTATFEIFEQIEPGTYRFVVEGEHRAGREPVGYEVISPPFVAETWRGIAVDDLRVDRGEASFVARGVEATVPESQIPGPVTIAPDEIRYPFTYDSEIPFLGHSIFERDLSDYRFCFRCTFRPWATHGQVVEAAVTVTRADGSTSTHAATFDGERWVASGLELREGDTVSVEPGQVRDAIGNTNGDATTAG